MYLTRLPAAFSAATKSREPATGTTGSFAPWNAPIVTAVVIAGNVRRADPHGVSTYPDVVSVAIAPLVVYVVGRRRRRNGESADSIQAFGARVGATAGAVFAAGLGAFTLYWLAAWPL